MISEAVITSYPVKIIHVNGVMTSLENAEKNRAKLEKTLAANGIDKPVGLAYNSTAWYTGGLLDAMEALYQLLVQNSFHVIETVASTVVRVFFFWNNSISDIATAALNAYVKLAMGVVLAPDIVDMTRIVSNINANLGPDDVLILVPHSQGNLFTKAIIDGGYLRQRRSPIAVVGVASPTLGLPWPSTYVSASNDPVSGAFKPNMTFAAYSGVRNLAQDLTNHDFTKSYLAKEPARSMIIARIKDAIDFVSQTKDLASTQTDVTNYAPTSTAYYVHTEVTRQAQFSAYLLETGFTDASSLQLTAPFIPFSQPIPAPVAVAVVPVRVTFDGFTGRSAASFTQPSTETFDEMIGRIDTYMIFASMTVTLHRDEAAVSRTTRGAGLQEARGLYAWIGPISYTYDLWDGQPYFDGETMSRGGVASKDPRCRFDHPFNRRPDSAKMPVYAPY